MDSVSYSQIHLVDVQTGERVVMHIGPSVGRSESEIALEAAAHPTMRVQFSQADARAHDAPAMLHITPVEPPADEPPAITVDSVLIEKSAPIFQGSILSINDYLYRCELYAWGKLPFRAPLQAAWLTSTGPVREDNEDAIGIYQHRRASLFAVADGVGGAEAGEQISEFTIKSLLARFHKNYKYDVDWLSVLLAAVEQINADVRRFSRASASPAGSTLTAVVIQEWDAHIIHVGDTRLYHWSGGRLNVLTKEHATFSKTTIEQQLVDKKALRSQKRNVLSKGIGKRDTIEPDTMTVRLQPGDKLILCSDGLYDHVPDEEFTTALQTMSPKEVCAHLLRVSEEHFNSDNATVLCIDVLDKPLYQRRADQPEPQERVFIGYSRRWSRKLKATEELVTQYGLRSSRGRRFQVASLLLVALVLVALIALRVSLMQGAGGGAVQLIPPTATVTSVLVNTPTVSPTPTLTITPSLTPSRTPTPVPPVSPVPVTSTLRPLPTSTLSQNSDE